MKIVFELNTLTNKDRKPKWLPILLLKTLAFMKHRIYVQSLANVEYTDLKVSELGLTDWIDGCRVKNRYYNNLPYDIAFDPEPEKLLRLATALIPKKDTKSYASYRFYKKVFKI